MGRRYRHLCPYGSPGRLHASCRRGASPVSPPSSQRHYASGHRRKAYHPNEGYFDIRDELPRTPIVRNSRSCIGIVLMKYRSGRMSSRKRSQNSRGTRTGRVGCFSCLSLLPVATWAARIAYQLTIRSGSASRSVHRRAWGSNPPSGSRIETKRMGTAGSPVEVPHGRLRTDFDHTLSAPIPLSDLGGLPNGSGLFGHHTKVGQPLALYARSSYLMVSDGGLVAEPARRGRHPA